MPDKVDVVVATAVFEDYKDNLPVQNIPEIHYAEESDDSDYEAPPEKKEVESEEENSEEEEEKKEPEKTVKTKRKSKKKSKEYYETIHSISLKQAKHIVNEKWILESLINWELEPYEGYKPIIVEVD